MARLRIKRQIQLRLFVLLFDFLWLLTVNFNHLIFIPRLSWSKLRNRRRWLPWSQLPEWRDVCWRSQQLHLRLSPNLHGRILRSWRRRMCRQVSLKIFIVPCWFPSIFFIVCSHLYSFFLFLHFNGLYRHGRSLYFHHW